MKERPILFSGAMVRALLSGSKTQTRRVIKDAPTAWPESYVLGVYERVWGIHEDVDKENAKVWRGKCPYGDPGDRLWVREAWRVESRWDMRKPSELPKTRIWYEADHAETFNKWGKLRPSIFMPRWASRITLEVTGVRIERLQGISEDDAMAEGVFTDAQRPEEHDYKRNSWMCPKCAGTGLHNGLGANLGVIYDIDCRECNTCVKRYQNLWSSINGPDSWDANPWVWVVKFRRIES